METKRCVYMIEYASSAANATCVISIQRRFATTAASALLDHTDKSPEYRAIKVDGIVDETMNPSDYLYDEETLDVPDEDDDIFGDDLFPFVRGNQR